MTEKYKGDTGNQLGALVDNQIRTADLSEADKLRAYIAQKQALDFGQNGAKVAWRNSGLDRRGEVIPGPLYLYQGANCRPYTHIINVNGERRVALGSACRKPDGTWQPD